MIGDAQAEAMILRTFKDYCASRGVVWQGVRPATVELFALGAIPASDPVPRPRSWPKELEGWWAVLPRELQRYLKERDEELSKVVHRSFSRVADAEQKLKEMEQL